MFTITYIHHNDDPARRSVISFATESQYSAEFDRVFSSPKVNPDKGRTLTGCQGINGDFAALDYDPAYKPVFVSVD